MMEEKGTKIVAVGQIDIDIKKYKNTPDYDCLPILPTRDFVLFPDVTYPLTIGRESSLKLVNEASDSAKPIGVVCQKDASVETPSLDDLYKYGVIADVLNVFEMPNGTSTALLRARGRFKILSQPDEIATNTSFIYAKTSPCAEVGIKKVSSKTKILAEEVALQFTKLIEHSTNELPELKSNLKNISNPILAINFCCINAPAPAEKKQNMLDARSIDDRAMRLIAQIERQKEIISLMQEIHERTRDSINEQQKRAYMQQQYDTLRKELYGDENGDGEIAALRERAEATRLSQEAKTVFERECNKLERLAPQSPDYSVLLSYLELLVNLPWGIYSEVSSDINKAAKILEADHYGLEKVKQRILEQMAMIINAPDGHAPIICLVGAPGVGKTSLGQSIASALGRKYHRVALGGLHDEAELRGHRRTYIGAMPGRIIDALRRTGTANPVILLDEIDKIGNDYKGDPYAALLEVLDPEQNHRFHDNYVDVDFDLSKVLFIATANTLSSIPAPLLDRMEAIDISGYLPEEKIEIAKRHLLPRLLKNAGLKNSELSILPETISAIIEEYTSESGVRALEKRLAAIVRRTVLAKVKKEKWIKKIKPANLAGILGAPPFIKEKYEDNDYAGVVTGLAWTAAGGCTLSVETSLASGKGEKLTLTGNLGDVMKESAVIALQHVKAHAEEFGIMPTLFEDKTVHIHVPEGAIPKDGPSAGITMATAILSAFTGRKVRKRIAMTGELTLRGRVLPIGGVKEKLLAAKRAGIETIILPDANKKDVEDIPQRYLEGLELHFVNDIKQVFKLALEEQ